MKRKIAWEKWDEDLLLEEMFQDVPSAEAPEGEEDLAEEALAFMQKIPKLISTPLGIFQFHDKMNPLRQYDCWAGHTNFDITKSVQNSIEKTKGVELLVIVSRYRFFLGVGKLFNFRNVRSRIEKAVSTAPEKSITNEDTQETVNLIKEIISTDKHWAIFISDSGEIDYTSTNSDDDDSFLEKVMSYKQKKKSSGGRIVSNKQE